MKIIVCHKIPFEKIKYHHWIDHDEHDVHYLCPNPLSREQLVKQVPHGVRYRSSLLVDFVPESENMDRIVALSEYDLLWAAELRDTFNLPGHRTEQILNVRDKVRMKSLVSAHGIRVPRHLPLVDWNPAASLGDADVIIKPTNGASSEGVVRLRSKDEIVNFIRKNQGALTEYEIEEFIDAPIVHFDGFVRKGVMAQMQASQYLNNCLDYANGRAFASVQTERLTRDDRSWVESVLVALQVTDGAFHIEAFLKDGHLIFLEAANRCGGADVVPSFELKWGINLYAQQIFAQLEMDAQVNKSNSSRPHEFFGWFIAPPGSLQNHAKIAHLRWIKEKALDQIIAWRESAANFEARPEKWKISYRPEDVALSGMMFSQSPDGLKACLSEVLNSC